ncbi:hypothetical protein SAMN05421678_13210 [Actinopolymorpha cephalotaxi]|uniref:Uncharacterized protein n=1 Tax=Actinopolymorpha cephalotaxi TaxID=504797 RepID=A0A1I3CEQ4_9ACTN|nr:hypothetical protein [Actinopolymorpha cephalotaxi]NYH83790.1 hypothetical protein [Actinopolymorpha cephalotaxi]SFH72571.1 hypothetical protein SAMN05421678_13210 [Actinopolymorpha cephalotaxi]
MFTGLPDFGRPERSGVAEGYVAYEQPGMLSVAPTSLSPEPLQVDQYLQERDGGIAQFTLVAAGFSFETSTTATDPATDTAHSRPAPLGEGWVRLVAPADLRLPSTALVPQPCDAVAGVVLPTLVRLDGVAGELLVGTLRAGLRTLGAVALVTVRGVAARCQGRLTVDVDALSNGIGPAPVRPANLEEWARAGLPGVTVTEGPGDVHLLASAVVDRIVARLAAPVFVDEEEGGWQFAEQVRTSTFTWDLTEPVLAVRLLRLTCDPVLGERGDAVVRRHEVPPLTDGREQVTVHSTLPAMPAGAVVASVRLTAPPAPPVRPFAAAATARLVPPTPASATLHLAPGEALAYDLEGSVVLETDQAPRTVAGQSRRVTADSTPVVTPADLGVRLISAHATGELLGLANVTVTARARVAEDPAVFVSRASLSVDDTRAWLAVPREAIDVAVEAEATTRGPDPRSVRQALPDAAVWLDPFSFTNPPWVEPDDRVLVVDSAGLRVAGPKAGADWRFLPLTAGPARDASGSPQLSLIEAAGLAMLMVTTSLGVSDAAQETARQACVAAGAAADVRLSVAPFEVEGAVQLLVLRDGQMVTLAAVGSSNTVTQDASFSTALAETDLATVKRALAGEAGLVAVHYLLRVAATGPQALALAGGSGAVLVVTDASTWRV